MASSDGIHSGYFLREDFFRMVVNAATRAKDLAWFERQAAPSGVQVRERDDLGRQVAAKLLATAILAAPPHAAFPPPSQRATPTTCDADRTRRGQRAGIRLIRPSLGRAATASQ